MSTQQQSKVVLVTGGSGGIGSEIARRLAGDGMAVMITYCQAETAAKRVVQDIQQVGGKAAMVRADVSKAADVRAAFEAAMSTFGGVDVVVNNAGVIIPGAIADTSESTYDAVFNVNVRGALMMMKQAATHLRDGGRVINISSTMVGAPIAGSALYAASKAALESFGEVLSKEVGARGITVNTLRLGATIPGMFAKAPPERQAAFAAASPFKRLGTPSDAADVVAFLTGEGGRWITGQTITVDGGAT
ncbi:SDR family oxidoreductase [Advenella mimigardefordensis]|uniref:Putative oxidoreductase, SDR family n=1 Tax=Advenella mimigardefordensis (strain DSM 17166 / LMG 22922 / DPN7) TaxID=1247726 RepID=W0PGG1_ADVMD|nr:SDR family oxidoreductase [Advenella mimigardefordensis]AHG64722.1 putative oxidoreductase, SDR family [Advenella mimigardefordensis DPN7]